mgnify:FL=1|jgi:long-chain fatty acid transport protein
MELTMRILVRSCFFFVVIFAGITAQNGTRMLGLDARSVGRGGTSIGTFDSPELMMTNPAGISFLNNSMLNADIALMFPTVKFQNTINDTEGDKNTFPMPNVAYAHKYENSPFNWGAGFFTGGGMGADFTLKHALYRNQDGSYNLQKYHSMLATMQGGLTAAYKFSPKFSVGVSLHMVYSMLEFSMPYSLNPSIMKGTAMPGMTFGQMFAAPPSQGGFGYTEVTATAEMKELTAIGFNGKIGVAYKVNEELSMGLSYTLPTNLTYKNGKASMDMTAQLNDAFGKAVAGYMQQNPGKTPAEAQAAVAAQFGGMGIDLSKGVVASYDLSVDLNFPQTIGFGLSYKATPKLNLSADFEWVNWEKAFDKMTIKLTNGTNSNINTMLGNTGAFDLEFPMNWKNSFVIKVGGEYKFSDKFEGRLGYAYGSNPVPETTVFPVFPAIVEHHVMAGLSFNASRALTLNAAFEMALNKSYTASNPSLIAEEYSASTSQLATTLIHFSATYNF